MHGKLNAVSMLRRKHAVLQNKYYICNTEEEDYVHLFIKCDFGFYAWTNAA